MEKTNIKETKIKRINIKEANIKRTGIKSADIIKMLADALTIISALIIMLFIFSLILTKKPSILGYRLLYISSQSMEPVLKTGSIVTAKTIKDESEINTGDICTYISADKTHTITHRIIGITENGYVFKGDNNPKADEDMVSFDRILYKIIGH